MTVDSRPPAAIRITRPYADEDEYLDRELDTLTRTSLTLVGAEQRPDGVVLRFEVALPSGQVLLRGEGRVVGYKQNAFEGESGLSVRFTRLDMRTKALIDKAAAMRDRRRQLVQGHASVPEAPASSRASLIPASLPPPSLPSALQAQPSRPSGPPPLPLARETLPLPEPQFDEAPSSSSLASSPAASLASRPAASLASPRAMSPRSLDREALLSRLRARARTLDASAIARLLVGRPRG